MTRCKHDSRCALALLPMVATWCFTTPTFADPVEEASTAKGAGATTTTEEPTTEEAGSGEASGAEPGSPQSETDNPSVAGVDAADCSGDDKEARSYCCAEDESHPGVFPHIQSPYCRLYCDDDNVYCVTETGDPLRDDVMPDLVPSQHIMIRVVSDPGLLAGNTVTLSGSGRSDDTSIRFGGTADEGTKLAQNLECSGACEGFRVASYEGIAPEAQSLSIRFVVKNNLSGALRTDRTYEFSVKRGKHFFEVGIILPITFHGTRTIQATPLAGTGLRSLDIQNDASWALGIAATLYPFGVYDSWADDPRPGWVKHIFAPLGVGLGTNVFSERAALREGYLTFSYRVAAGAIFGAGVSFVQGDFLADGYSRNSPISDATQLSLVVHKSYMFRPHFVFQVSANFLAQLIGLLGDVQSVPSDGSKK